MTQQQYTPVSWQDETTSQQGTLINAERLNQMQTAHHFADGLEETDTVPTADPGVAYHKIVYCTADNTLYRWDGTQWTADIDDPTRELLEEHLADRDNPHQVTKSQVGLGNADNTSDADKPISTATQTALNAKADKSDTYTKAQTDSLLGGKVDKLTFPIGTIERAYIVSNGNTQSYRDIWVGAIESSILKRTPDGRARASFAVNANTDSTDLVNYGWASTELDKKADKSDTYTKAQVDTALATKADKATTYTKTETDTLLGGKADKSDTYTKTEVQTYVSNALDGYLPMVRTTGNQAISGVKDFTAQLMVTGIWDNKVSQNLESTSIWRRIYYTTTASLSNQVLTLLVTPQKGNNDEAGIIVFYATTAGVSARWLVKGRGAVNDNYCIVQTSGGLYEVWAKNADGNRGLSFMRLNETNWGSTTNNWTRDLTTKDAAFDPTTYAGYAYPTEDGLAHTYGAETIAGAKTFSDLLVARTINTGDTANNGSLEIFHTTPFIDFHHNRSSSDYTARIINGGDGVLSFNIQKDDGTSQRGMSILADGYMTGPARAYDPTHTTDIVTLTLLDGYTPMVRTTGNQDISGNKTLTGDMKVIAWGATGIATSPGIIIAERDTTQNVVEKPTLNRYFPPIMFEDGGGTRIGGLRAIHNPNGTCSLICTLRNADGTYKNITLATSDA